jgi:hypothetical protein
VRSGQRLIVVRGLDDSRAGLARLLAGALAGPAVHVAGDDLGRRWIVHGLPDQRREVEAVYRLLRLVSVSYLKEGYSVVVDAPFVAAVDGSYELRTDDIRDLTRLAHSFRAIDTGVVTVEAVTGLPESLVEALAADLIEGEVRVRRDLAADEDQAIREILRRLGM